MGGVILLFIMALLVGILVTPALRARFGKASPPPEPSQDPPHEVIVHKLDDHRKKPAADDAQKPQG